MAFSFIYTGYNNESGEVYVTLNGKDYVAHLNPADLPSFEAKLKRNPVDALNYLKSRTAGGLKRQHLDQFNEFSLVEFQKDADVESKLREFYQLAQKVAALSTELKSAQAKLGTLEEDITAELERANGNASETKEFVAKIERKGYDRSGPKYKEAFQLLLSKVNPALKKIAEEALEATKSVTTIKPQIAVGKRSQNPLFETGMWEKVKNILRKIASRISGYNDFIEQALAQAQAKLVEGRRAWRTRSVVELIPMN